MGFMEPWVQKALERERKKRKIGLDVKVLNKNYYLYHSTTRWDKELRKVRKVAHYIGRLTPDGVAKRKMSDSRSVHEYGNGALLMKLSQEFLKDLEDAFPYRWKELLACAIVKTIQPVPLKLVKSRWEKLHLSCEMDVPLSPKTLGEVLREVGKEYAFQKKFFDTLTKKSRTLAFDMSSVFSHSENLRYAEKGYNPDHAYTKQVNFVLFFSIDRQVPVLLKTLHGSVRDVKALVSVIDEIEAKNSVFVLDRGFASYSVPELLRQNSFSFVLPLRRNFKIIDYERECAKVFTYRKRGVKWTKWKTGRNFLYLFEDVKMRAEEETTFIGMMEEGKRTRNRYKKDSKQFGKISVLSDLDIDGEKVYRMLKSREDVEMAFDALKNELENDKTYLRDDDAVRGYFFVSFLSLYLYCRILRVLKEKKLSGKLSVNEVLLELSKAYQISLGSNGSRKTTSAIPAKTENIMRLFGIDINPKTLLS